MKRTFVVADADGPHFTELETRGRSVWTRRGETRDGERQILSSRREVCPTSHEALDAYLAAIERVDGHWGDLWCSCFEPDDATLLSRLVDRGVQPDAKRRSAQVLAFLEGEAQRLEALVETEPMAAVRQADALYHRVSDWQRPFLLSEIDGNKIYTYGGRLVPAFDAAQSAQRTLLARMEDRALALAQAHPEDREFEDALIEHLSRPMRPTFKLAQLGSEAAFQHALSGARKQCAESHAIDTRPIEAVGRFARLPAFRERATAFLCQEALGRIVTGRPTGTLVNQEMFAAVCRAVDQLGDPAHTPWLRTQFQLTGDPRQHYEMHQAGGPLARMLAARDDHDSLPPLQAFLAHHGRGHAGSPFVMSVHYAIWLLQAEANAPLKALADSQRAPGLAYVAAALADLDVKAALPLLQSRVATQPQGVTREALLEAIARLHNQAHAPAPADRMVHLFGVTSATAVALGADADNVFAARAQAAASSEVDGDEPA